MYEHIQDCLDKVTEIFPKSFIHPRNPELIIEPKNNIYFRLDNIENETEFKCKMIEFLSRPAHKGLSQKWQSIIRKGLNRFLSTNFNVNELETIYTYLGNCCNREKTLKFINSNYDMSIFV